MHAQRFFFVCQQAKSLKLQNIVSDSVLFEVSELQKRKLKRKVWQQEISNTNQKFRDEYDSPQKRDLRGSEAWIQYNRKYNG